MEKDANMSLESVSRKDRVAIVTGAGMGMGAATARVLAGRGAVVVVSDINSEAARSTVELPGGTAEVVLADVADENQVAALVTQTVSMFGRLDCAVNNAAIIPDTLPIAEADMAVFDNVLRVDLRSVMLWMKER